MWWCSGLGKLNSNSGNQDPFNLGTKTYYQTIKTASNLTVTTSMEICVGRSPIENFYKDEAKESNIRLKIVDQWTQRKQIQWTKSRVDQCNSLLLMCGKLQMYKRHYRHTNKISNVISGCDKHKKIIWSRKLHCSPKYRKNLLYTLIVNPRSVRDWSSNLPLI